MTAFDLPDTRLVSPQDAEHFRRTVVPGLSDEQVRWATIHLAERAAAADNWYMDDGRLLPALATRRPAWSAAEVARLFDLGLQATPYSVVTVLRVAAGAAETLDPAERRGLAGRIRAARQRVDEPTYSEAGERVRLHSRLTALAESADGSPNVWLGRIHVEDGWSRAAVDLLGRAAAGTDPQAVRDLLDHARALASGPRPTRAWLGGAAALLDGRPGLLALVHDLLELAHTCPPALTRAYGSHYPVRVGPDSADLVRGLLWSAQVGAAPWLVPLALALAPTLVEPKALNACYAVLGRRADADAIAALVRLQRGTRHRGKLKQIAAALDEAATTAGVSRGELTELTIPDCGLDGRRERRMSSGGLTAVLAVDGRARVRVTWEQAGTSTTKPPPGADAALTAEVRGATTELKKALAGEKERLEDLLAEDLEWPFPIWRRRYLEQPVTAPLAERLLWTVQDGGHRRTILPATHDGPIEAGDAATVRLWHPVDADPAQVRAWREHILAVELPQPFKQAFREIYVLTPAEEETAGYSNRFAAHVLRYHQAYALMKQRRWGGNYLGGWDGGFSGEATREFPAAALTAVFHHEQAGDGNRGDTVEYCTTDRVRFERGRARTREEVPLADVPRRVFSEAMRDVDLFVGVTSIATDPTWADRGPEDDRFDYWQRFAFGVLTANGQVRRQVIEHLLPKLKIRDRARLDGNYLVVDGRRHTYRIHIGSGNILMSPNDRYLCIVPSSRPKPAGVRFLPFEGDEMLSVVLSKALLLADDHKITDPSILRQLG
ncbi:DUF4132 domain-containing protein [Dactylosporangium matsuzakiense]|uniref:DUF4132 domain-containing protein n=1 Tax=Dactylosporangium matsuzakiense TaxID=53360 RepID=A0A9W6KGY1_9ACTN|nr:DUF4132 domain-containing protein [Dactylosporangium matsuzakiense]UWZ41094.1 DUF4132 domain-containing protein [Dactylosporangium matsuzakiense]GLL01008.1 hypothetical protein GCM10017581_027490 [Dactylosporangium matsuzakiense]